MIFVVSGPSGCGKSTLIKLVRAARPDVRFSVSHTTRSRRETEAEGRDYYFIDPPRFRAMIRRRAFLEWAVVHGAYYGTSRAELGKGKDGDLILDIDVQGARQVRKRVASAVTIFVLPPSFAALRDRLLARGQDSPEAIAERLETARREARECPEFAHVIINDDLNEAADELASIIVSQRTCWSSRRRAVRPILSSFKQK